MASMRARSTSEPARITLAMPMARWPGLHVAVAVADGLRQRGIDHDGARAARPRLLEDRHHVDVGHRGIAAPEQEQARVLGEIERIVDLARAEGLRRPVIGLAAAEPADGLRDAAVEVEEAL